VIQTSQNKFASVLRLAESGLIVGTLYGSCLVNSQRCPDAVILIGLVQIVIFLLLAEPSSLYSSWRGAPLKDELVRTASVWLGASAILALFLQNAIPDLGLPRDLFLSWVILNLVSLTVWRMLFRLAAGLYRNRGDNRQRVAIAPADARGLEVGQVIESMPHSGMDVAGWFDDRGPAGDRESPVPPDRFLGGLDELVLKARSGEVQRIYLAFPLSATERVKYLIQRLADTTASVYIVPDFYTFNLVNSRIIHLGNLTAISVFELPYPETDWYLKRAYDVIFSLAFLAVA